MQPATKFTSILLLALSANLAVSGEPLDPWAEPVTVTVLYKVAEYAPPLGLSYYYSRYGYRSEVPRAIYGPKAVTLGLPTQVTGDLHPNLKPDFSDAFQTYFSDSAIDARNKVVEDLLRDPPEALHPEIRRLMAFHLLKRGSVISALAIAGIQPTKSECQMLCLERSRLPDKKAAIFSQIERDMDSKRLSDSGESCGDCLTWQQKTFSEIYAYGIYCRLIEDVMGHDAMIKAMQGPFFFPCRHHGRGKCAADSLKFLSDARQHVEWILVKDPLKNSSIPKEFRYMKF